MAGTNSSTINIQLKLTDKGTVKGIKQVGTEAKKAGDQGKKSFDSMDTSARKMSTGVDAALPGIKNIGDESKASGNIGRSAFDDIGSSARTMSKGVDGAVSPIKTVGTEAKTSGNVGRAAFDSMDTSTRKMTGGIKDSTSAMVKMGAAVAAVAGAAGIGMLVESSFSATEELQKNAKMAGVSTTAYQELAFAAGQHSITQDALTDGLKELSLRTDEYVQTGAGPAKESFDRLGFSQQELNDRLKDSPGLLREVIKRMQDLDTASQIRIADEIFGGTGGEQFVAMIDAGADSLDGLTRKAHDLGVVMEDDVIQQSIDAKRKIDQLSSVISTNFSIALAELAPDIEDVVGFTADWVSNNKDLIQAKVPEYVGDVRDSVGKVKALYDSVPDDVKGSAGIGLVGGLLFGGTAGKVLFVAATLNQALKNFNLDIGHLKDTWESGGEALQNIFDVISGKKDWNTGELKEGIDAVTFSINEQTAGWEAYKGVVTMAIDSSTKGYEKYQSSMIKAHKAGGKSISEQDAATKKANEKTLKEFDKLYAGYQKSQVKLTEESLKEQADAYEDAGADKAKVEEWLDNEITDLREDRLQATLDAYEEEQEAAEDSAEARSGAYREMYRDLEENADGYYEYEEELLQKQRNDYEALTGDKTLADAWYVSEHEKMLDRQTLASDDFFAGVKLGLKNSQGDITTWAEAGKSITEEMTSSMSSAFSDTLYAAITGDIDSIGEIWDSMLDSMLQALVDTVAQMVVEWAVVEAMSFAGSLFGFESGAWDLDIGAMHPDSYGQAGMPAIVHQGEMIIPASVAEAFRSSLESEGITDFSSLETVLLGTSGGGAEQAGVADLLYGAFRVGSRWSDGNALRQTDWTDPEFHFLADELLSDFISGSFYGGGTDGDSWEVPMMDFYKPAYDALYALDDPYAVIKEFVGSGGSSMPAVMSGSGAGGAGLSGLGEAAAGGSAFMSDFAAGMALNLGFNTASGLAVASASSAVDAGDILGMAMSTDALTSAATAGLSTAINTALGTTTDSWGSVTSAFGSRMGGFVAGLPGALAGAVLGAAVGNTVGDALDARNHEKIMDAYEDQAITAATAQYGKFFGTILGQVEGDRSFAEMAAAVNEAHGGHAVDLDLLDPVNYDADYGFVESGGYGSGTVSGVDTGGGFGDMAPGFGGSYGVHGMKDGGVIQNLMVPAGEDGYLPVQFGEGVVSRPGMEVLGKINDGTLSGADPEAIGRAIAKELISNMSSSGGTSGEMRINVNVDGDAISRAVITQTRTNGDLVTAIREAVA